MSRKFVSEVKYIASIYPGIMPDIARNVGPSPNHTGADGKGSPRRTVYHLEPVPRGAKPYVIEVADGFEFTVDHFNSTGRQKVFRSVLVPCEELVASLLKDWTEGLVGVPHGALPGIMAINGTIPTQAEMRQLLAQQTALFEWGWNEGERLNREQKWKEITQVMRDGAKWLGRERNWSNPSLSSDTISCPLCTKPIPGAAIVCPECGRQIKEMPPEVAALALNKRQAAQPVA